MATQMPGMGLMPPEMLEQQQLTQQQQMLIKALQEQAGGLMPDPVSTGRMSVLNLGGITNAMRAQRTKEELENNERKRADVTGRYQASLLRELAKYDGSSAAIKAAQTSPYPEVRALAERDQKRGDERFNKVMDRASLRSVQESNGDLQRLQPKEERQLQDGTVIDMTEGRTPTRVAGGWQPGQPTPQGAPTQVNPLTGKVDAIDKAPRVTTQVNAGAKGEEMFLKDIASDLVKRSSEMRANVPKQLSALDRAASNIGAGIYQGPTGKWRQAGVGVLNDLGLSSDQQRAVLARTEAANADIGQFVSAAIQALGANPSNADREYAVQTAGGQPLSQAGALRVIQAAKQDIAQMVRMHNEHVKRASTQIPSAGMATIEIPGLDNVPQNPPVAGPQGTSIDDIVKQYLKPKGP